MAHRESLYARGQAGDYGAEQRRIADGRGDDATSGTFWGDRVRVSVAGHGALPEFSGGEILGAGVRLLGRGGAVPRSFGLFALSPRGGGDEISGGFIFDGG